jgi:peroxiredoxin
MRASGSILVATLGFVLALPFMAVGADLPQPGLAETNGTVSVGQSAPPVVGTDMKGVAITTETFKGRPVLVDFSSLFCISCQDTIKEFARLEKLYKGTDLVLVVITDGTSSPKVMSNIFGNLGSTYAVIRDEGSKLFDSYGVRIIPFQVLIDRQGIIRKIHTGFNPEMESVLGLKELASAGTAGGK